MEAQNLVVNIEHAIMHYLNPDKNELILVDNEIDLTTITTKEFLSRLVQASLVSANSYAVDIAGTSPTLLASRDILASCATFVPRSRELATALYNIMTKKKTISSGDLLIIVAHDCNGPLLAIFKTELNHEYERKYNIRHDGTSQVILSPNDNVVPSEHRPPQKCAFIHQTRTDYDVKLADNQVGMRDDIAKFFYRDFLGCELLKTSAARTLTFCRAVENWREQHAVYLPQQGLVSFTKALDEQLKSSPLFFESFAERALRGSQNPELSVASFAEFLVHQVFPKAPFPPPEFFEPDLDTANKLLQNINLTVMEDIQITGPSEKLISIIESISDQDHQLDLHITTPWVRRSFQKPRT